MYIVIIVFFVCLVLYLGAMTPKLINRKDLTRWKGRFYAHRGLHNRERMVPENSLLAFHEAVQRGYGIELDVHITKDAVPVVFHDHDLRRMCGENVDRTIEEMTVKELNRYTLHQTDEKIPTLDSVLKLVSGRVPLIVELKTGEQVVPLCKYTQSVLDSYQGVYCIESFNPFVLLWYKKNRPSIIRGQLSSKLVKKNKREHKIRDFVLENLLLNFVTRPDFIAFNHKYSDKLSFKICRKLFNIPAFAWTVRTPDELSCARKLFDSFIFEAFTP